ncbi:MAG: hypothetical protein K0Q76_2109 [Panacagrimonas sp.]|jgi:hypothetical protein|nr:hypothetical protein [Panacagrimonas sp.]MCC2657001.1 hypothetical protein [Panacagrimonas sp.]
MADTPESPNTGSSPWVGSTGFPAHPTSPVGGGGPGNFVTGNRITGAPGNDDSAVPHPLSPTGRHLLLVQNHVDALDEVGVALDTNVPVSGSTKPNPPPKTKVETITGASRSGTYEEIKVTVKVVADGVDSSAGSRAYLKVSVSNKDAVTPPIMETEEKDESQRTVTSFAKQVGAKIVKDPTGKNKFTPTVTLQIMYGPSVSTSDRSAYGRGTTDADIKNNDTSIGFHEHCHLQAAIAYFKDSSKLPAAFTSKFGEKTSVFEAAQSTWGKSFEEYFKDEEKASLQTVDEVGSPTLSSYLIDHPGHKHHA